MKTETMKTNFGPVRVACYALPESAGFDRWTILFPDEPASNADSRLRTCLGMSGHGSGLPGRHLGKRAPFSDMPESLRLRVTQSR